jgi:hypothetical protein
VVRDDVVTELEDQLVIGAELEQLEDLSDSSDSDATKVETPEVVD